ncbi:MAG: amidohydrolase family protein [Proteobacteria bacterium]|nr:amidohydrolase family protein [Pseudomonadota bacterium]MDA0967349.1 amidohydrolase family protein [Pseudomonadota bacterium]
MRNILLITTFIFLTAFYPIDKLGGNFNGTPKQMKGNLSSGAMELIRKAYADVDSSKLVDYHTHIVGIDETQGTSVNTKMLSWWHPIHRIKTSIYLSGSGVKDLEKANEQYIERLVKLIRSNPHHGKHQILAFDHHYNPDGTINHEKSEFYVSNEHIWKLSQKYPDIFIPVISVHPYRKDAIAELIKWAEKGVRWVKWLPNAHGIDASNPRLDEYYQTMKKYNITLLTHVGEEQAVEAEEDQKLGNPLSFRKPLDMGVKVVMAHCASLGENEDLDNPGKKASSFDLFMRLMDNPKYDGLLYGEISAMTQFNRLPKPLLTLLERTDLHHRLINGSDYPLPAINVVIHTRSLVRYEMITKQEREYLNEIYKYNPLVFDYVLKRTIRHPKLGTGFNKAVFETIR